MRNREEHIWFLFQFLHMIEKEMSVEEEKQVMIEKAINLRLMCDYVVSCSYGDIVLIICMLHNYVQLLDEVRSDMTYRVYYRDKFLEMADRLAAQIEYDYEKQMKMCLKKMESKEKDSDIGEEATVLTVKHGRKNAGKEAKQTDENQVS